MLVSVRLLSAEEETSPGGCLDEAEEQTDIIPSAEEEAMDDEDAEEGEILEDGEVVDEDDVQEGALKVESDEAKSGQENEAEDKDKKKKDEKSDKAPSTKRGERRPSITASRAKENESRDKRRRKRRRRESDDDENDSDGVRSKRRPRGSWPADDRRSPFRTTSPDSGSDASESNDEEGENLTFNEEIMMQMFKQMMEKMKKDSGENKKKTKVEKFMEKMMRNQSNLDSREMREMVMRNKRLFRSGNFERERGERIPQRGVRERERRAALRNERRGIRDRERDRERAGREGREREPTSRDRDRERIRDRDKERERPRSEQSPKTNTCRFFLDGKCHRGSECPFTHDTPQQKKKDICKFYLQGYCGKGEHCLFMHGEFPCKFFHTGAECYSGDNCRFSHEPLTDETRALLKAYLDSGELPDEQQQASGTNNSSGFPYQPVKPVSKRHAVLGDVTEEMKTSYWTWLWQQEMKELELAYTGNKRNLFCIEKPFVVSEKPLTPEPIREDDYDEREQTKVMSFYIDTMGDVNNRIPDDEKLIEMSYHDEDLRLPPVLPVTIAPNTAEETVNNQVLVKNEIMEPEDTPGEPSAQQITITTATPVIPEESLPKSARDLLRRIRSNQKQGFQNEDSEQGDSANEGNVSLQEEEKDENLSTTNIKEEKKWLSESEEDEDTEDQPLKAALKKLQTQQQQHQPKEETTKLKPKIDIAKMLSVIRQTTNQMSGASLTAAKHADFWQNIFSGTTLATSQSEYRDPRLSGTPPQNESRDPRLKRSKAENKGGSEASSSPTSSSDSVPSKMNENKISDNDYKLMPVTVYDIDYSCYVALYRSDVKLKNDPRLQKFFSKLPNSVIDHLSKLLPTPQHQPLASTTSTSSAITSSSPTKKAKRASVSPPKSLPPLPPLTLTQPKSTLMSSMVPPPPPLMSPFELTTSKPSFAVPNPVVKQETSQEIIVEPKPSTQTSSSLSSTSTDVKPITAHLPQGLTSLVSLVTTKDDLRTNLNKQSVDDSSFVSDSAPLDVSSAEEQAESSMDRPLSPTEEYLSVASPSSEGLTIAEDTPASPTSRRSSSEIGSPPQQPLTIAAALSPQKEETLIIAETDDTRESLKDVFKTIDPTASPFC